jgi:hypothetical protein
MISFCAPLVAPRSEGHERPPLRVLPFIGIEVDFEILYMVQVKLTWRIE